MCTTGRPPRNSAGKGIGATIVLVDALAPDRSFERGLWLHPELAREPLQVCALRSFSADRETYLDAAAAELLERLKEDGVTLGLGQPPGSAARDRHVAVMLRRERPPDRRRSG
jgi:hypothetical protein